MRASSSAVRGPVVSQPERSVSATAATSSSSTAGGWKPRNVPRRVASTRARVTRPTVRPRRGGMVARGNRKDRDESASDRARRSWRTGSDRRRLWRQLLVVLRPGRGHDHHLGPDGEDHLRRRLDRSGGGALRQRDQGVQQELPERPRHVQAGRRQPAHRALDRRRRGQPAGHGRHRATGPDPGVRQQEGAAADRLRQADDGEELRPGVDPARHVQRRALQRRLQGEQQVTRLVQRPGLHERRREAADDAGTSS